MQARQGVVIILLSCCILTSGLAVQAPTNHSIRLLVYLRMATVR